MALVFPTSPSENDTFPLINPKWIFKGGVWELLPMICEGGGGGGGDYLPLSGGKLLGNLEIGGNTIGTTSTWITLSTHSLSANTIKFNPTVVNTSTLPGELNWNVDDGTLNLGMGYDGVVQQIGMETFMRIKAESAIPNGTPVWAISAVVQGNSGLVLAQNYKADGTMSPKYLIGVATQPFAQNDQGFVTTFGLVRECNLSNYDSGETWAIGDVLYPSPYTAGHWTKVEPQPPHLRIPLAMVLKTNSNNTNVTLMVRRGNTYRLEELHNVIENGFIHPNGSTLAFNSALSGWLASDTNNISVSSIKATGNYNNLYTPTFSPSAYFAITNNTTGVPDNIIPADGPTTRTNLGLGTSNNVEFNNLTLNGQLSARGAASLSALYVSNTIGIGTSAPSFNLDVNGTARVATYLTLGSFNYGRILPGSNYGRILFTDSGHSTGGVILQLNGITSTSPAIRGLNTGVIQFTNADLTGYVSTVHRNGTFYGNLSATGNYNNLYTPTFSPSAYFAITQNSSGKPDDIIPADGPTTRTNLGLGTSNNVEFNNLTLNGQLSARGNSSLSGANFAGTITSTVGGANNILHWGSSNRYYLRADGVICGGSFLVDGLHVQASSNGIKLRSTLPLTWASDDVITSSSDTFLYRDGAANTLALRNSTNAQTFRLYRTYTSSSVYQRLTLNTSASAFNIAAESTSVSNVDLNLLPQGTGKTKTTNFDASGDITASGGAGEVDINSLYGSSLQFRSAEALVYTTGSTNTVSAPNIIPAGAFVLGTVVKVISAVSISGGLSSFSVGDDTDNTKWGTGLHPLSAASTSANFTTLIPSLYPTNSNVVLTADSGGLFTGGSVRVAIHYMSIGKLIS